mmetsp:Transcript_22902/g.68747  ORF Transcript_22902/g.68747 Transcript_22902/m.68747 type:complete len:204 (+) Transcript_22902:121-732(+)
MSEIGRVDVAALNDLQTSGLIERAAATGGAGQAQGHASHASTASSPRTSHRGAQSETQEQFLNDGLPRFVQSGSSPTHRGAACGDAVGAAVTTGGGAAAHAQGHEFRASKLLLPRTSHRGAQRPTQAQFLVSGPPRFVQLGSSPTQAATGDAVGAVDVGTSVGAASEGRGAGSRVGRGGAGKSVGCSVGAFVGCSVGAFVGRG